MPRAAAWTLASVTLVAFAACGGDDGAAPRDGGASDALRRDSAMPRDAASGDAGEDGGPGGGDAGEDAGSVDAGPPPDPLDGIGEVETVMGGFGFLEGPRWRPAERDLLFTDIPADLIYRLEEPSSVSEHRNPSGKANGLALDPAGRLVAAEHWNRRVSRTLADGTVEAVAERFEGDRLNSPNDIAVRSDGTIYFTDPPYGLEGRAREVAFNGVYRVSPDGALFAEWRGGTATRPNGIALSPDEAVLYVADTADGNLRAWDVATDGSLGGERVLAATAGGADGMAVDTWGNLYVTTRDGIEVFAPDGVRWGVIAVPDQPANCNFGGPDLRTLYITARTTLYRVRTPVTGLP